MKTNKFIGLGLLVVLSLLVVPLVYAASTMNVPVAAGNYTGTITWSVTTTLNRTSNVTCYHNSSGGEPTTILGALVTNTSAEQKTFTGVVDISGYTDAATYNISCVAKNDTSTMNVSRTGVTFDSTDPVVTLSVDLSGESQSFGRGLDYSCTTADGIDSGPTETFAITHPSEDPTSSTSLTLQSTTLTFLDTDYAGDYVFTCTSTDYTGNSASSSNTVTIDAAGYAQVVGGSSDGIGDKWVWIILIVVAIWLFVGKKK